jgi:hypothetical protein
MKTWKLKQEIYHRLNKDHSDDLNNVEIKFTETAYEDAYRHFIERVDEWVYPAKSYFVAICYASWISKDFDEDFYELLNDPMLLAGNDPYFVPYENDKELYDRLIEKIDINNITMAGMVPDVREYYDAEFGYE